MDERLRGLPPVTQDHLRRLALPYYARELSGDYFVGEGLQLSPQERDAYAEAAGRFLTQYHTLADRLLAGQYREELGLPPALWELAAETWRDRLRHPHLFGRFDVAGVVDGSPARLIEFNADTATVLAEAALVQDVQTGGRCWNELPEALARRLGAWRQAHPDLEARLAVVTLGFGEDDDNAAVLVAAARQAGFEAQVVHLPALTFSPGEGVYAQLGAEEWLRYDFLVKLFPWDWVAAEEPDLLDALAGLLRAGLLAVANPPYASLWQSKAALAELHRLFPQDEGILAAGIGAPADERQGQTVTKPLFGREGENVRVERAGSIVASAAGDYGKQARMWQAYTPLPRDADGEVYQAGVYVAGEACGLGFRRRDGLIVDADSEFIAHLVE